MAFFNNNKRQIIGYSQHLNDSLQRLKVHLRANSFVDVDAVRNVVSRIGGKDMNLVHLESAIEKVHQTSIIADRLLTGLRTERKFIIAQKDVSFSLVYNTKLICHACKQ